MKVKMFVDVVHSRVWNSYLDRSYIASADHSVMSKSDYDLKADLASASQVAVFSATPICDCFRPVFDRDDWACCKAFKFSICCWTTVFVRCHDCGCCRDPVKVCEMIYRQRSEHMVRYVDLVICLGVAADNQVWLSLFDLWRHSCLRTMMNVSIYGSTDRLLFGFSNHPEILEVWYLTIWPYWTKYALSWMMCHLIQIRISICCFSIWLGRKCLWTSSSFARSESSVSTFDWIGAYYIQSDQRSLCENYQYIVVCKARREWRLVRKYHILVQCLFLTRCVLCLYMRNVLVVARM